MIVNVNQCASTFDETLHALKYSAIAKQVVIGQEQVKEETTRPERVSARDVSMMLAQAHTNPNGPRPSIAFGSPGSRNLSANFQFCVDFFSFEKKRTLLVFA